MTAFRTGTAEQVAFLGELLDAGLLTGTGVHGVYARGSAFEQVRLGFDSFVSRAAAGEEAEGMYFPPLLPREQLETSGYLGTFPHLAGTVFGFTGDEAEAMELHERAGRHEDWSPFQHMSDLVLMPAACYPLYPAMAARGPLPEGGVTLDTGDAYVFRREPSDDPSRLQMFHMREIVRIADAETVAMWREGWRARSVELLRGLGLDVELDLANDPFFGRGGRLLASSQRDLELKWELLVPVRGAERTAVASSNYHQDHFGHTFALTLADGEPAHTACMAFGEERITLALLSTHGLDPADWPADVRAQLHLDG